MSASAELWPFEGRAAIFDFDGTLADTAYIWHEVDRTFLERRGLPVPTDYGAKVAALGFAKGAQYTIDRFGLNETVEDICDEWNGLGHDLYRREVTLREGAEQYLRSLSELGIPCALATTNDVHVVSSMRHFDPDELFDACVYGAEVGKGKDEPDIYVEAARRLNMNPEDCIVFEDIVVGVRSAKRVGMKACGVYSGDPNQPVRRLQEESDLWLDDWRDIEL